MHGETTKARRLLEAEAEIRRLRDELVSISHVCEHQPRNADQYAKEIADKALASSRYVYPLEDE